MEIEANWPVLRDFDEASWGKGNPSGTAPKSPVATSATAIAPAGPAHEPSPDPGAFCLFGLVGLVGLAVGCCGLVDNMSKDQDKKKISFEPISATFTPTPTEVQMSPDLDISQKVFEPIYEPSNSAERSYTSSPFMEEEVSFILPIEATPMEMTPEKQVLVPLAGTLVSMGSPGELIPVETDPLQEDNDLLGRPNAEKNILVEYQTRQVVVQGHSELLHLVQGGGATSSLPRNAPPPPTHLIENEFQKNYQGMGSLLENQNALQ